MLTPEICLPALHAMKEHFGGKIWGPHSFADAFNPLTCWVANDTLGLNLGIMLLSAENLSRASVWRWFMENPEAGRAMQLAGIVRA